MTRRCSTKLNTHQNPKVQTTENSNKRQAKEKHQSKTKSKDKLRGTNQEQREHTRTGERAPETHG